MKIAIIGAGGFGREVYHHIRSDHPTIPIDLFVDDGYCTNGLNPLSTLDTSEYEVLVAIGDPVARSLMVNRLPKDTRYFTFIHSSVVNLDPSNVIGEGSIICAGVILTTNIQLGKHTHLNLGTTIGHDCVIDEFFTTAPHVAISGNCNIKGQVYFGTNSCVKEKINICSNVTIGLNAGVVKHITETGTYVGTPCKRL